MEWCRKCGSYCCNCNRDSSFTIKKKCSYCGYDHDDWNCPEKARRDELRRRVRDVHNPHWGKFWINTEGNNYRQVLAGGEAIDSQVNGV